MKIESNGDEKITVALSTQDMSELDITYEDMDYSNIETRRVIWTILDQARRTLGKPIDTDGKLLIEATPLEDGGCLLCFTSLPICDPKSKHRLIMKKEAEPLVFCAFDENAFLDALKILGNFKNNILNNEIYLYNYAYYLIIKPKLPFFDTFRHILSEFGNVSLPKKVDISQIYEYGKKLS